MQKLALDQCGNTNERGLAFVDKNNDIFLIQLRHSNPTSKLKKLGNYYRFPLLTSFVVDYSLSVY